MGTEVLTPRDFLSPHAGPRFYTGAAFSAPKPSYNRRKNQKPVQPVPPRRTPSPKSYKKVVGRKGSPPPTSSGSVGEGFRLLKRGEALGSVENKSVDRRSPEPVTPVQVNLRRLGSDPGVVGESKSILGRFKAGSSPAESKSVRFVPDLVVGVNEQQLVTPTPKPAAKGRRTGAIYAGPAFTAASPEPSSLPVPSFLQKSSSTGSSEDEASKALRCLLKLNIL